MATPLFLALIVFVIAAIGAVISRHRLALRLAAGKPIKAQALSFCAFIALMLAAMAVLWAQPHL
jgi:hypothetical protein